MRALLPQNAGCVLRYAQYARDFGEPEDIVMVVEAGSFESVGKVRWSPPGVAVGFLLPHTICSSGVAQDSVKVERKTIKTLSTTLAL